MELGWMFRRPSVIILGLAPTDVTDWQFVEVRDVPRWSVAKLR
mgnify:CR=1 FL=1